MPERRDEPISWANDLAAFRAGEAPCAPGPGAELLKQLAPFTCTAHLPFPSAFLFAGAPFSWLARRAPVLCRDGLVPILDFFRRHPAPVETLSLLIPEPAAKLVPQAWSKHVSLYRVRGRALRDPPRRLLLAGAMHELCATPAALEAELEALRAQWGEKAFRSLNVLVHFTGPLEGREPWEMSRLLGSTFGGGYRYVGQEELGGLEAAGSAYVEINSGLAYLDSTLRHQLLARGFSEPEKPAAPGAASHACSPHHELEVFSLGARPAFLISPNAEAEYRAVASLLDRGARPWEPWAELILLDFVRDRES